MSRRTVRLPAEYAGTHLPTDRLPEVALFGRSNAGKSTLINRIAGVQGLAHVAKTPGKTRYRHFFRLGRLLYLVDLPGYGYGAVSRSERETWTSIVEDYLRDRPAVVAGILVVDARRFITDLDLDLVRWWKERGVGELFHVAAKADKLNQSELAALRAEFPRAYDCAPERCFIVTLKNPEAVDALRGELFRVAAASVHLSSSSTP